jgi:hypothetical protein
VVVVDDKFVRRMLAVPTPQIREAKFQNAPESSTCISLQATEVPKSNSKSKRIEETMSKTSQEKR